MELDPQKFFIGLMDFFSILLPGAISAWLLKGVALALVGVNAQPRGVEGWAVFVLASYLLGHLIFLIGSWLDEFYDWVRYYTLNTQIALMARRRRLLWWPFRIMIWLVFKRERNLAVSCAKKIKEQALGPQAADAVNTFQWSKALLNVESPASLSVVQRFEADSKFFRSFTVVLLVLLGVYLWQLQWQDQWTHAVAVFGLLIPALWRYMEQRYKSTNQAYWSVITLAAKEGKVVLEKSVPEAGSPTHAGGVVYRIRKNKVQYLLVEAKDDPKQWVLPKGHIEEKEQHEVTAVREVHEETGVWAAIVGDLGDSSHPVEGTTVKTHFFLMQAKGRGWQQDKDRHHDWLELEGAIKRATHPESQSLLRAAEKQRIGGRESNESTRT